MKWTVEHDLTLCGEVLLQEPFKHPKNSKERGEVWSNIAVNLNSLENPSFKVSKRSVRDRLTLLQTKYKGKIREEEKASGIDCEETPLDAAIEEILEKEKAADMERNEQSGTQTLKEQREKASAEEVRRQAMERLGKTQKRNAHSEEGKPSKKGKRRSSDAVEYLKEKVELESQLRREEMDFKKTNQQMLVDQQSQMHKQQLEMMKMLQQQNQSLVAILEKSTCTK